MTIFEALSDKGEPFWFRPGRSMGDTLMPPASLTRDQLVDRLAAAFRRYGYEGASMTRLAAVTGLGKASLYHHFPEGKEQMARAVIEATRSWFEQNVFGPLEDTHPPRQRLVTVVAALARYYENGRRPGLPLMMAMCEDRERFAGLIHAFYARWITAMTQVLVDAGLARDIAQRRAHDGVERIEGALAISRAADNPGIFERMAAELPDQLLAGADRATLWTVRSRFPASLSATSPQHRFA